MKETGLSAEILGPDAAKRTVRAAQMARLRAVGRTEGIGQSAIAAAEASLASSFALGDFMDALRHAAGGHD